ncbi:MAG TPA: hypothetical protein DCX53_03235 [Anaerolineae bacterium]|nr:hypothetical protein [Anaerolineae bacterium]
MPDIQHLIGLLKSDDPNKRYDACEDLRVFRQQLPREAIDALRLVINDPDPDVADAAQRAISLHDPRVESRLTVDLETENEVHNTQGRSNFYSVGLVVLLILNIVNIFIGELVLCNLLIPVTFAFLVTSITAKVLDENKRKVDVSTRLKLTFIITVVIGCILVAIGGGFFQ